MCATTCTLTTDAKQRTGPRGLAPRPLIVREWHNSGAAADVVLVSELEGVCDRGVSVAVDITSGDVELGAARR